MSQKLQGCGKCGSQFDVASMQAGTTFVCGNCKSPVTVKAAGPVVQPVKRTGVSQQPATVVMTPDQMRKALRDSRSTPSSESAQPKLPAAMQKRAAERTTASRSGQLPATSASGAPAAKSGKSSAKAGKSSSRKSSRSSAKAKKSTGGGRRAASGGGRRDSGGRSADSGEKKSNTGMFVGIGVVVVALAVVGVMMMNKGGDDPGGDGVAVQPDGVTPVTPVGGTETAAGGGESGTTSIPIPTTPKDAWDTFLSLSNIDQEVAVQDKIDGAGEDMTKLEELVAWLGNEKLRNNVPAERGVVRAGNQALEIDDSVAWAHEAIGEKNAVELVQKTKTDASLAFQYPDLEENELDAVLDKLNEGSGWVAAAEYDRLEALCKKVLARHAQLDANPRLIDVERQRDWIRSNPLFADIKDQISYKFVEPYVIFQEYDLETKDGKPDPDQWKLNEARKEKGDELVRREGILFNELHRRYREMFAERFKLGSLAENGRLLKALMLWNRDTFNKWHEKQDSGVSGFVRAYYSPVEKRIVSYVGGDALKAQDEFKVEGDRIQKGFDQVTIHEGLHQLMHEYTGLSLGKPLKDDEAEIKPRISMWGGEGMAEFMAAVEYDRSKKETLEDVTWYHHRLHLERIDQGRRHRKSGGKWWQLKDLVRPNNNGDGFRIAGELFPQNNPTWMFNIFYGQSWAFTHFCWFYDNGKYRENLLDYVGKELKHEHGPEALAKCFGIKSTDDWGEIQDEYSWYWDECMNRKFGKISDPRTGVVVRNIPANTDPPTGLYDPNDTGDEYDSGEYDDEDEDEDMEDDADK